MEQNYKQPRKYVNSEEVSNTFRNLPLQKRPLNTIDLLEKTSLLVDQEISGSGVILERGYSEIRTSSRTISEPNCSRGKEGWGKPSGGKPGKTHSSLTSTPK